MCEGLTQPLKFHLKNVKSKGDIEKRLPQLLYILLTQTKLDQGTWLCRTHLNGFVDKIWTILDHIRLYYTIFGLFGPF